MPAAGVGHRGQRSQGNHPALVQERDVVLDLGIEPLKRVTTEVAIVKMLVPEIVSAAFSRISAWRPIIEVGGHGISDEIGLLDEAGNLRHIEQFLD